MQTPLSSLPESRFSLCPIYATSVHSPHQTALITEETAISYQELHQLVNSVAERVSLLRGSTEDPLAFFAHPTLDTILLLFALLRLGITAFPVNPKLPTSLYQHLQPLSPGIFSSRTKGKNDPAWFDRSAIATLLFTSGSTGAPKVAALTANNHLMSAQGAIPSLQLASSDRWLFSLPLFHVGGLATLFRTFMAGATLLLSPLPLHEAVEKWRATHLSLVPTQLFRLFNEKTANLTSVKVLLLGGAPIGEALYKEALRRALPLYTSYGLSEMASMITLNRSAHADALGTLLPYRQISFSDEGEILVKGETLFKGYWGSKDFPLSEDWFATRDLAVKRNNKLFFLGRKDNLFISGGENIHPEEIENVAARCEGVVQAVVVPKKDLEWGARPVLFLHSTRNYSLEEIREKMQESLPKYKLPTALFPLEETPFKLHRKALEEIANRGIESEE